VSGPHILAHKTIPTPLLKFKIPAPTKDTTIRETTALLCKIAVANVQVAMALNKVFVAVLRRFLNVLVTKPVIQSSKRRIPNKNIPKPHNKRPISAKDIQDRNI
jgi:hypothetical protein